MTVPLIFAAQKEAVATSGLVGDQSTSVDTDAREHVGEAFTLDPADVQHVNSFEPIALFGEGEMEGLEAAGAHEVAALLVDSEDADVASFPILMARADEMRTNVGRAELALGHDSGAAETSQTQVAKPPVLSHPRSEAAQPLDNAGTKATVEPLETAVSPIQEQPGVGGAKGSAPENRPNENAGVTFDSSISGAQLRERHSHFAGQQGRAHYPSSAIPEGVSRSQGTQLSETLPNAQSATAKQAIGAEAATPQIRPSLGATAPVDKTLERAVMVGPQGDEPLRMQHTETEPAPRVPPAMTETKSVSQMPLHMVQLRSVASQTNSQESGSVMRDSFAVDLLDSVSEVTLGERVSAASTSQLSMAARPDMPRHIAAQMAQAMLGQASGQIEISLQPEELGRVRMTVSTTETVVVITVVAERQDTADMMRRHAMALSRELASLGFEGVELSFEQRGGSDPEQPHSEETPKVAESGDLTSQNMDVLRLDVTHDAGMDPTKALDKRI